MGSEVEIKIRLTGHEAAEAALRSVGAEFVQSEDEVNTLYDLPNSSLRTASVALRIREARDRTTGIVTSTLTFKGPRQLSDAGVKSRPEHEVVVSDATEARAILGGLGYAPTLTFTKRRETWTLGKVEIVLDHIPALGHFMEIEAADADTVMATLRRLSMENGVVEKRSYAALIASLRT